jgi:MIP family channel proteins
VSTDPVPEPQPPELGKRLIAEVIGTFGFFFIAFAGVATLVTQGALSITPIGIAAGFGFGLAASIFMFGHISGGHFNPAVTVGLVTAGRFPASEVVPYWIAQIVGGLIATLVIRWSFNKEAIDAVVNLPGKGISDGTAFLLEAIVTALFVLVICTVATDARAPWNGVFAPFAIGLFIFTALTAVGGSDGGSYNPARALDPVIVSGKWGHVWIYTLAPLLGAAIAGFIHAYFKEPERRPVAGAAVRDGA